MEAEYPHPVPAPIPQGSLGPRSPRAPWGPPYSGGGSAQLTLTSVTAKGGLWDPGGGGGEVHACSFAGEVTHTGPGSQAHSWEPAQV